MKVFISHSSRDKKFVRTLKDDLTENGIETWFDEDEMDFGDILLDKLTSGISESDHFIIILSPNSIQSDWVQGELTKALELKGKSMIKKVIPILFQKCELPKVLDSLLYANLTNETYIIIEEKLRFHGDGYLNFMHKLVKTIRSKEKAISKHDLKDFIEKETKSLTDEPNDKSPKLIEENPRDEVDFYLKVVGYLDQGAIIKRRKAIKEQASDPKIKNLDTSDIFPVLLPSTLKLYQFEAKKGEILTFRNGIANVPCHFGGFKTLRDTHTILIQKELRERLNISKDKVYLFRFNLKGKSITVL